jgi:hypothetical protein
MEEAKYKTVHRSAICDLLGPGGKGTHVVPREREL